MRALVALCDSSQRRSYARRLLYQGFAVDEAETLSWTRKAIDNNEYDCVLVDRQLEDGDAIELVATMNLEKDRPGVVVLAEGPDPRERIDCLAAGADDCLSKPVDEEELALRARKVAEWSAGPVPAPAPIQIGRVTLDTSRQEVLIDNSPVCLSPMQYRVFTYLARHQNRLVHVEELLEHCWDSGRDWTANPAHTQITRLRTTFKGVLALDAVRGSGYQLRVVDDESL